MCKGMNGQGLTNTSVNVTIALDRVSKYKDQYYISNNKKHLGIVFVLLLTA